MIKINNLSYDYPDGTNALFDINLDIRKDEFVVLVGSNGAGKSTLLLHLNGVLRSEKGDIVIDGLKLDKKNIKSIRQKVGVVFQNPDDMLFSPTVYEDVAFGPRNMGLGDDEVDERVSEALRIVGMSGYDDKNPHHLSLGQKKRVSIAAIISMRPSVIVLDEPTSHLDPKGKKEIMGLIRSLKCTTIIATHDMQMLDFCDKAYILESGRIVYSGKPDKDVLEKNGLL